jgi:hypothetical protein
MQINKFLYIINKFVNVVTNNFLKTRNTVAFLSSLSLLQNTTTVHHRSSSLSNPNPDHQNVAPGSGGALASTRRHDREPHQGLLIVDCRHRRRDLLFGLFFFLEILQICGFVTDVKFLVLKVLVYTTTAFLPSVVVVMHNLSGGFGGDLTAGLVLAWWCWLMVMGEFGCSSGSSGGVLF